MVTKLKYTKDIQAYDTVMTILWKTRISVTSDW